jgi:propanol-preferring alcohol dehydrogenase
MMAMQIHRAGILAGNQLLPAAIPLHPETGEFPLLEANEALLQLKNRAIRGAKVLRID